MRGLRSGDIPAWNPSQFSGAPFAGDPLSGWTYLPAMILFTILPLSAAASGFVLVHLLLAGLFTYALARVLSINVAGSMLAAVAYEFNGFMYWRNLCCSPYAQVMVWLPLAILGAELAIRSSRWLDRGLWWGVGGLALSQILAAWPGQGSYYALLALGGYVFYRTILFPPENITRHPGPSPGTRLHGGAVLIFGFGLAAAGLLPRLEYQTLSNLAEGYGAIEGVRAAWGGNTLDDCEEVSRTRSRVPRPGSTGSGPRGSPGRPRKARRALLRRPRALHPHPGGSERHAAAFGAVPIAAQFRLDTPARPGADKGDPLPRVRPTGRGHLELSRRAGQESRRPGGAPGPGLALPGNPPRGPSTVRWNGRNVGQGTWEAPGTPY